MNSIIETATAVGSFKTLAVVSTAADIVDKRKGPRPFSVPAPTDDAVAKIPKADLDKLLTDKVKLKSVLTYHVVRGKLMSADIKPNKVKSVQGAQLAIDTMSGVMVNDAKVVAADNGVIYAIDAQVTMAGVYRSAPGLRADHTT